MKPSMRGQPSEQSYRPISGGTVTCKDHSSVGRFGIMGPILVDEDRKVSAADGMLGQYGHQNRPRHSFALVNRQAEITWVRRYAEMFVSAERPLDDLP